MEYSLDDCQHPRNPENVECIFNLLPCQSHISQHDLTKDKHCCVFSFRAMPEPYEFNIRNKFKIYTDFDGVNRVRDAVGSSRRRRLCTLFPQQRRFCVPFPRPCKINPHTCYYRHAFGITSASSHATPESELYTVFTFKYRTFKHKS